MKTLSIIHVGILSVLLLSAPTIHLSTDRTIANDLLQRELRSLTDRGFYIQLLDGIVEAMDPVSGQKWLFSTAGLTPREPRYTGLPTLTIDLRTIDTSVYAWKYNYHSTVPVDGGWGFQLNGGDIDGNGLVEVYGNHLSEIEGGTRIYELSDSGWMFRFQYPSPAGQVDDIGDLDANDLVEVMGRYGDSLFVFEQSTTTSLPIGRKFSHRQWYQSATSIPNMIFDITNNDIPELLYRGSRPDTLSPLNIEKVFVTRYAEQSNDMRDVWSAELPEDCFGSGCTGNIATGDFDDDSKREFVTSNFYGQVYVVEHAIKDSFGVMWSDSLPSAGNVTSGNMDENNATEFFVGGKQVESDGLVHLRMYVYGQCGNNDYRVVYSIDVFPVGFFFMDLYQTVDVDGDGQLELLLSISGTVLIIKRSPQGEYSLFYFKKVQSLESVAGIDVDNDGTNELLISRFFNGATGIKTQTEIYRLDTSLVSDIGEEAIGSTVSLLGQNYPNPFNPTTTIQYTVGTYGHASLRVYDLLGREVMNLVDGYMDAGQHAVQLDASSLATGLYFYRLSTPSYTEVRKMLLLK